MHTCCTVDLLTLASSEYFSTQEIRKFFNVHVDDCHRWHRFLLDGCQISGRTPTHPRVPSCLVQRCSAVPKFSLNLDVHATPIARGGLGHVSVPLLRPTIAWQPNPSFEASEERLTVAWRASACCLEYTSWLPKTSMISAGLHASWT